MTETQVDELKDAMLVPPNGEADPEPVNPNLGGVDPWPAPALTHTMWLLEMERWLVLKCLTLDSPTDEKDSRKRRAIHDLMVRGLSDDELDAITEADWCKEHEGRVDIQWTKTELEGLKKMLEERLSKPGDQRFAFRPNSRQTWYFTDVIDRIGFVLSGK
ncbi:MAG: hypothetical protein GTO22_14520 [Gemmatimonadales bacterium]|nr:hypothetical protein [Gemmatimonadales bacterium]